MPPQFIAYGHQSDGRYKLFENLSGFDEYMVPYYDDEPICDHTLVMVFGNASRLIEQLEDGVFRKIGRAMFEADKADLQHQFVEFRREYMD